MRYPLILVLFVLTIGLFGCEPDAKGDAPVADVSENFLKVDQPDSEILPEKPEIILVVNNANTDVYDGKGLEPDAEDSSAIKDSAVALDTANGAIEEKTDKEITDDVIEDDVGEPDAEDSSATEDSAVASDTANGAIEEKTDKEIADDVIEDDGDEPDAEAVIGDSEKPEGTTEPVKTVDPETTGKTATAPPKEAKGNPKDKTAGNKDKKDRPKLVDTEFFKKSDYVLKNFVDKKGVVNYRKLRRKKRELLAAVDDLGNLPVGINLLWSKNDQKAFLLNAHNILTLKLIIDNYPIQRNMWMISYPTNSIMQILGGREKTYFLVCGFRYTLDEIEELALKTTKDPIKKTLDPRYCFALSNATVMGGKLRNEAYHPDKLDKQIDEQVKKYFADPKNFSLDTENNKINLSSLFKIENYKETFENSEYATIKLFRDKTKFIRSIMNFIYLVIDEETAKKIESENYEIKFETYDWLLNERQLN